MHLILIKKVKIFRTVERSIKWIPNNSYTYKRRINLTNFQYSGSE